MFNELIEMTDDEAKIIYMCIRAKQHYDLKRNCCEVSFRELVNDVANIDALIEQYRRASDIFTQFNNKKRNAKYRLKEKERLERKALLERQAKDKEANRVKLIREKAV